MSVNFVLWSANYSMSSPKRNLGNSASIDPLCGCSKISFVIQLWCMRCEALYSIQPLQAAVMLWFSSQHHCTRASLTATPTAEEYGTGGRCGLSLFSRTPTTLRLHRVSWYTHTIRSLHAHACAVLLNWLRVAIGLLSGGCILHTDPQGPSPMHDACTAARSC